MDKSIKELLSQVYELEGLLLLVENHKQNTNSFVYDMIKEKGKKIESLTANLSETAPDTTTLTSEKEPIHGSIENAQAEQWHAEGFDDRKFEQLGADSCSDGPDGCDTCIEEEGNQCMADSAETAPLNDAPAEVKRGYDIHEMEYVTHDTTDDNFVEDYSGDSEIFTPKEEEMLKDDEEKLDEGLDTSHLSPNPTEESEEGNLYQDEDDEDDYDDEDESLDGADEDEEIEEDDLNEEYSDEEPIEEPITLDEALQRQISKDLLKAFTFNDLFRYRRELFGNSDVEMKRNLHLVEAMNSYAEAQDYFFNDLQWDPESSEVKDFMEIIKKHFS